MLNSVAHNEHQRANFLQKSRYNSGIIIGLIISSLWVSVRVSCLHSAGNSDRELKLQSGLDEAKNEHQNEQFFLGSIGVGGDAKTSLVQPAHIGHSGPIKQPLCFSGERVRIGDNETNSMKKD